MSSSRAPPNDCAIIKKNVFLRAKNACCSCCYNTDLRARPCVRARFAKGHSLAWAFFFFFVLTSFIDLATQHYTTQLIKHKKGFFINISIFQSYSRSSQVSSLFIFAFFCWFRLLTKSRTIKKCYHHS